MGSNPWIKGSSKQRGLFLTWHGFRLENASMLEECFVLCPAGDSIVLILLDLVKWFGKQHPAFGPGDPLGCFIPTRTVPDNFEVKDKKRKMYPRGLWNSCERPQKQHFIRGTIQKGWSAIYGEIQMRSFVWGEKPKRFVSSVAPSSFFFVTILSWVTLMWTKWLKDKATWLDLIPAENRLVG